MKTMKDMYIMIIINTTISMIISSFLINYFPTKKMNKIVLLLSFIFFFFNFSMVLLIPVDIFYSNQNNSTDKTGKTKDKTSIDDFLIINYSINCVFLYLINKFILNFVISYLQSGEFKVIYKIKDGLKSVLIELSIMIVLGSAFFSFLYKFNIFNLVILIYEVYNMIFVYIYIGVTIIKLPQKKYLLSDIDRALKYYQFKTHEKNVEIKENNDKIMEYFYQCKKTLKFINNEKNEENQKDRNNQEVNINNIKIFKNIIEELFENIKILINKMNIKFDENEKPENEIKIFKKKEDIVKANKTIKEIEIENKRYNLDIQYFYNKWNFLKTLNLEEDLKKQSLNEDIESNFIPTQKIYPLKSKIYKTYYNCYHKFLTLFFIIIGIAIILLELSLSFNYDMKVNKAIVNKHIPLLYITFLYFSFFIFYYALYSTKFKKIGLFQEGNSLYPNHKTDYISLLSFSGNLSDITFPLCVNIIKLLKLKKNNDKLITILEENFADDLSIDIFQKIQNFLSLIIIIVMILTYFRIIEEFKRKKDDVKFEVINEKRDVYIEEGKKYLMKLNAENIGILN